MALVTARGVHKGVGSGRAKRQLLVGADLDLEAGELVGEPSDRNARLFG